MVIFTAEELKNRLMGTVMGNSHITTLPATLHAYRPKSNERLAVLLILLIYAALQIQHLSRGGAMGQDFLTHRNWLTAAATDPQKFAFGPEYRTSPPVYHLLMAPLWAAFKQPTGAFAIGLVNLGLSIACLLFTYLTIRLLIGYSLVSISMLLGLAFMPAFQISSIVVATDALCQLPVSALALCLVLYVKSRLSLTWTVIVSTLAMLVTVSAKYTAGVLIFGFALALLLTWRAVPTPKWKLMLGVAVMFAITMSLETYWLTQSPTNAFIHFSDTATPGQKIPKRMSLRSIFWFRTGDLEFFNAPSAWELYSESPAKKSLARSNSYSYPGLLWLSLNSDILDILQPKKSERYWGVFGHRTTFTSAMSKVSVTLGFFTFSAAILLIGVGVATAVYDFIRTPEPTATAILGIASCFFSWLGGMVLVLTQARWSYLWQYWHPRLVMPSVVLGAIICAWAIRRSGLADHRWARIATLWVVIFQAGAQVLSISGLK
jgi:hypothetical protein